MSKWYKILMMIVILVVAGLSQQRFASLRWDSSTAHTTAKIECGHLCVVDIGLRHSIQLAIEGAPSVSSISFRHQHDWGSPCKIALFDDSRCFHLLYLVLCGYFLRLMSVKYLKKHFRLARRARIFKCIYHPSLGLDLLGLCSSTRC